MPLTTHANLSDYITDEDNPLLDRKYPEDRILYSQKLPVIHSFSYDAVPNFSDVSMGELYTPINQFDSEVINDKLADTLVAKNEEHVSSVSVNATQSSITHSQDNTIKRESKPPSQNLTQRINSKTLSSRQAIAQAKAQEKALQKQKAEELAKQQAEEKARYEAEVAAALLNPKIHEGLLHQRKSILEEQQNFNLHSTFGELAKDLQTVQLPETGLSEQTIAIYNKAVAILTTANISTLSDVTTQQKAYSVVDKFANNNIADAILRKAYWLFQGNPTLNLAKDTEQALQLTKIAASQQDNRAEKLLSKLYFSGDIVVQDSSQGQYWLEQAAAHGHSEAIRLTQGLAQMSVLKETQRDENLYLKRLGIGVVALIVMMIIVLVFVKI